jgi:transcriptional regulator NrdR family protein
MALLVDTNALIRGSKRVADGRQARKEHLERVFNEAVAVLKQSGSEEVAEADVVRAVMAAVPTDQVTAVAAVDRLKVRGLLTKDMSTGKVRRTVSLS